MAKGQKIIPSNGMDLSIDESYLPETMARFIKGWYLFMNDNNTSDNGGGLEHGSNAYVLTPNQSNELFSIQDPFAAGINKSIGGGFVPETGMYYSCIWNSNNNHSIWRLDAINRSIRKVIETPCLDFQYDQRHFISQTRFTYTTYDFFDKNSNIKKTKTWIILTDDNSRTKQINVEDAIATNGFNHTFFKNFNGTCCDLCTMITLGSPSKPKGCISINPVPRVDTVEEKTKQNVLNFRIWQFRLKAIDVWGRESIHGVISAQYYNSQSTSCTPDETKYPRCVDLTFDADCKYIAKFQLEYRNCGVGNSDELQSDWKAYEIIEKYSDCNPSGVYVPNFWDRQIKSKYYLPINDENPIHYNEVNNLFTVRFCGNKEVKGISNSETNINQNYIANKSNSVFRLGNKIGVSNNERGFNPLLCSQKDAIKFSTVEDVTTCNPLKYIKIEIWGYIYSPLESLTTNIRYVEDANAENVAGYGFAGESNGNMGSAQNNVYHYQQVFDRKSTGTKQPGDGTVEGFVMYAVGHEDIYCVSKQYDISDINNPVFKGVMSSRNNSKDYIQKWEFIVPQGSYIFRIGDPTVGLKKDSSGKHFFRYRSANMIGLTSLSNIGTLLNNQQVYELEIDACSSDINLIQTPVMIYDVTKKNTSGTTNLSNFISGYFINTNNVL